MAKKNKAKKLSPNLVNQANRLGGGWINADPARIRFQHSKIRPYFSGCGRSVSETLDSIRKGEMAPEAIPPIQVLVGPDEQDGKGPWYFSLNNRRLWVLKRCREEGLLENNVIRVRVRPSKSNIEYERYSIENCALEATFKREKPPVGKITNEMRKMSTVDSPDVEEVEEDEDLPISSNDAKETIEANTNASDEDSENESSSEDESPNVPYRNPFDLGDSSSESDSD